MEKSVVATYHNSCRSFPYKIEIDSWIRIIALIFLSTIYIFDSTFGLYLRQIHFIHLKLLSVITDLQIILKSK